MNELELLEAQGQMNIFDYIDVGQDSKRTRKLVQGDRVKLRLYVDEVDYVRVSLPHLLEVGVITEVFDGYYSVKFDSETIKVDGDKLLIV